jgi:hypothetical protein|tara:strand:+ start:3597 stop:3815 length:219 start_codon:yes stop_codon:yes gene_type:complete
MAILKVEGYSNLIKDTRTKGVINTNITEYSLYMKRVRDREKQGDEIRNAVKEINSLKSELREIKDFLKKVTQ